MNNTLKILITSAYLLLTTPVLAAPFTYSSDGSEVTDSNTGLIWRRCSTGQAWSASTSTCRGTTARYTHQDALGYAELEIGWRLPNVKELSSITDRSLSNPPIDPIAFPGTSNDFYWTSSPAGASGGNAWVVSFNDGYVSGHGRTNYYHVRLVR